MNKLQNKIVDNLMARNYPVPALEKIWELIKPKWQEGGEQ